jgi:hypothetical protein
VIVAIAVPTAVYVIWWVTLIVAVVVVLPLAWYLLHRAFTAARQIERYAARTLVAGVGVAGNTANIAALKDTIGVATGILATAAAIEGHSGVIEGALASRAGGD